MPFRYLELYFAPRDLKKIAHPPHRSLNSRNQRSSLVLFDFNVDYNCFADYDGARSGEDRPLIGREVPPWIWIAVVFAARLSKQRIAITDPPPTHTHTQTHAQYLHSASKGKRTERAGKLKATTKANQMADKSMSEVALILASPNNQDRNFHSPQNIAKTQATGNPNSIAQNEPPRFAKNPLANGQMS